MSCTWTAAQRQADPARQRQQQVSSSFERAAVGAAQQDLCCRVYLLCTHSPVGCVLPRRTCIQDCLLSGASLQMERVSLFHLSAATVRVACSSIDLVCQTKAATVCLLCDMSRQYCQPAMRMLHDGVFF